MATTVNSKGAARKLKIDTKDIKRVCVQWSTELQKDLLDTLKGSAWGYPITAYTMRMMRALHWRATDVGLKMHCISDLTSNEFVVWLERRSLSERRAMGLVVTPTERKITHGKAKIRISAKA